MASRISPLERARLGYRPRVPQVLESDVARLALRELEAPAPVGDAQAIREAFPRTAGQAALELVRGGGPERGGPVRIGVVLSGGQAPGGHNVIAGLFDGMPEGSRLLGFRGGPAGIVERDVRELTADVVDHYRNTGGFDLIGSGRDKIETAEQLAASRATCQALELGGVVIVGGDDSNTNAAVLAESFREHGLGTAVIGVPKTIDGDLRSEQLELSFGFDTACRVYSELIGNIARDAKSAGKYWHFIRLMGRSTSHVTLECALQTRPDVALIGEEVDERGMTLERIADDVARTVARRAAAGRHYGVCLVPEGLIEFIPEMRRLIGELNDLLGGDAGAPDETAVAERLSADARAAFGALPARIRKQLLLDRDAHGNVRVSQIETEQLLVDAVAERLARLSAGAARGFRAQTHFLGYEGRCAFPSNFDADYTYALGRLAAALVAFERTGYICALRGLAGPPERWQARAVPITALMHLEQRRGRATPVVAKAHVRLDGPVFRALAAERERMTDDDGYRYPGPIQYFGPEEVAGLRSETLRLERGGDAT